MRNQETAGKAEADDTPPTPIHRSVAAAGFLAVLVVATGVLADARLLVYASVGLILGFALANPFLRGVLLKGGVALLGLLLAIALLLLLGGCGGDPFDQRSATHFIEVEYLPQRHAWIIHEKVTVKRELLEDAQDRLRSGGTEDRYTISDKLGTWSYLGSVDDQPVFARKREHHAEARRFPLSTDIEIPFNHLEIGYYQFVFDEKSRLKVSAPKHLVSRMSLPVRSKMEAFNSHEQWDLILPVQSPPSNLGMRITSPLLRGAVIQAFVTIATWPPLKWIVLAFFAVFADQIKERYLTPIVTRILDIIPRRNQRSRSHAGMPEAQDGAP